LTAFGDLRISFNASMNPNVNITQIDDSVLSLYIIPADGRDTELDFNASSLNFTWKVTDFTAKYMDIKLNFSSPLSISPLLIQDTLIVKFKDLNFFYSLEVNDFLDSRYRILSTPLKKQVEENVFTKTAQQTAKLSEALMRNLLIGSFALNFVFQGAMSYILSVIRCLQMVLHFPMFVVIMPGNVTMFFQILLPFVMFDIFDPSDLLSKFIEFDEEAQEALLSKMLNQMTDLGYESHNAIMNLGSVFAFALFYLCQVIMFWLLYIGHIRKLASF
jgi:hypothetical protein